MASSAARLRRSALAERARLQAEWAVLKGPDVSSDVLRGVVALVSVGEQGKAAGLRAALAALGATVLQTWSPLVTHVVWGPDGCRQLRAKSRALAARLVSPLWVEACATSIRRLPERAFPTATRPSDLPSPRTLRLLLKKADRENLQIEDLLNDTSRRKSRKHNKNKLRISSEHDTSSDTTEDSSHDASGDLSTDLSKDLSDAATEVKVPKTVNKKSRRKLFTYKEGEDLELSSDEEGATKSQQNKGPSTLRLTQKERRDLARAERMARRLADGEPPLNTLTCASTNVYRIAITGMSRPERQIICEAIKKLNCKLQGKITKKTTHVILGSCCNNYPSDPELMPSASEPNTNINKRNPKNTELEITGIRPLNNNNTNAISSTVVNSSQSTNIHPNVMKNLSQNNAALSKVKKPLKPRTVNALEGAARGCRVLYSAWVLDSLKAGKWLYPYGYEVMHLRKVAERARIERRIYGFTNKEYGYDVFSKLRVYVTASCGNRDAVERLLKLCGAVIVTESGAPDVTVGDAPNVTNPKWVYDSVAAARPRTVRRYLNHDHNVEALLATMNSNDFNAFMDLDFN